MSVRWFYLFVDQRHGGLDVLTENLDRQRSIGSTSDFDNLVALCDEFDGRCAQAINSAMSKTNLQTLDDDLWHLTTRLCEQIDGYRNVDLGEFRRNHFEPKILRWYRLNPAVRDLWSKPSGHSGDYRTIELICQDSRSWVKLEDVFLNHMLRSRMADQHRSKVREQSCFMSKVLEQHAAAKLLNAGCGPSFDLRSILSPASEFDTITLVDVDASAISFSRQKLAAFRPKGAIQYLTKDVVTAIRHLRSASDRSFHAILFGGLFDYLNDRTVIWILRNTRRLLASNGEVLFSQVSPSNPNRTFMEWYGSWSLHERDEQRLTAMCIEAGYPAESVRLHREESGIAVMGKISIGESNGK